MGFGVWGLGFGVQGLRFRGLFSLVVSYLGGWGGGGGVADLGVPDASLEVVLSSEQARLLEAGDMGIQ